MRTVSFSNPKVAKNLNEHFVSTFTNTYGDPTSGMSIKHSPGDTPGQCIRGNGKQNVQTIFMDPQGRIFHVATGYLGPEDLYEEMDFAHRLFEEMKNSSEPENLVAESHRRRLKEAGFNDQQIDSQPLMNMAMMTGLPGSSTRNLTGLPGSTTRNRPPNRSPGGAFDFLVQGQILSDNQFPIRYPMINQEELQRNPALLVGNGKSFFASSGSGG